MMDPRMRRSCTVVLARVVCFYPSDFLIESDCSDSDTYSWREKGQVKNICNGILYLRNNLRTIESF